MTILAIVLLILLGIVLLLIEFTIIPGITIAGVGGFISLIASLFIAFSVYGKTGGILTIITILFLSPLLVYYFFKSKSARKIILKTEIDSQIEYIDKTKITEGSTGVTLGRLAPIGKVKINGEVVEGQSIGNMIDENTPIKVLSIKSNKVIVEQL